MQWPKRKSKKGQTTIYKTINAYHRLSCEFQPRSWRGVLNKILCDKVSQ